MIIQLLMIKKYLTNTIENKYWEEALINEEEVPKNIMDTDLIKTYQNYISKKNNR